jgi:hypothetical protein
MAARRPTVTDGDGDPGTMYWGIFLMGRKSLKSMEFWMVAHPT